MRYLRRTEHAIQDSLLTSYIYTGMVAVYNTFGDAEAPRSERQSSNYYLVVTAACAVFVVAAVLVAGRKCQHMRLTNGCFREKLA
jgi:hypothetical protein